MAPKPAQALPWAFIVSGHELLSSCFITILQGTAVCLGRLSMRLRTPVVTGELMTGCANTRRLFSMLPDAEFLFEVARFNGTLVRCWDKMSCCVCSCRSCGRTLSSTRTMLVTASPFGPVQQVPGVFGWAGDQGGE
jgi:hypothetical protein